jgi:alkylation response protein AidB-like acyl-CoA dehydrogenase
MIMENIMDFGWSDTERQFRQDIRDFIRSELNENVTDLVPGEDPYSQTSIDFCGKLASRGWLVPHWPVEYGGSGASPWMFAILSEEMWAAGEPRGSQYMNVNWIGPAIIKAGSDAQKQQHLNRIARGDVLWCQGFSEVEAGSDLAAMKTSARREGDTYIVDGEKVWTSYASKAEFCFLLARTSETGISIFLVPMATPGIRVEVIPTMLDVHVIHRLTFDGVVIPAEFRLGEEDAGWNIVRDALSDERVGTPRFARAEIVLDRVLKMIRDRDGSLNAGAEVRAVEARAACHAARLLSYKVRQSRATGQSAGPDAYVGRAAIVRAERHVADLVVDLLAEESLVTGSIADGEFRTSMIAGLGGGSYEMQLNLISRLWLNLPKGA